ncbi:MAG: type II toxin-antitoxin system VapC family toxin [Ignisphaera sp.]
MIVIDASSLAKYVLKEPNWGEVEAMLALGSFSIDYVVKEVSNAIWKYYTKFKKIDKGLALKLLEVLLMLVNEKVIVLESQDKYLKRAFELSLEYSVPVYDTLYVAQAEKLEAKLLTSDRTQVYVAQSIGVETIYIL